MKNAGEIVKFWTDAQRTAFAIASDHGAEPDQLVRHWCVASKNFGPSIASGPGRLTEGVFLCVQFLFDISTPELRRSRKFTIYQQDGVEDYPGAQMMIRSTPGGRQGRTDAAIAFFLQVGNRADAQSWGHRIAAWRDSNLLKALSDAIDQIETMPMGCWTEEEDYWPEQWR